MTTGLHTYPDPPTVMEVERARLNLRRRFLLALLVLAGLKLRAILAVKRG